MSLVMIYHDGILPKTNIFAPENGWLEDHRFLLGPGLFSEAFTVSFREGFTGQIIATSAEVIPKDSLVRESPPQKIPLIQVEEL